MVVVLRIISNPTSFKSYKCVVKNNNQVIDAYVSVCGPYVGLIRGRLLDQIPTFEWYMARFVVENGYQKNMCYKHRFR